jgi:hypothetical protein
MGESRDAQKVLVVKTEAKRPLAKRRRRWENIKMYVQYIVWEV